MTGQERDGPKHLPDRRQFTVEMAMALLGGASITIACGGGSPSAPTVLPTPTPSAGKAGDIAENHGHEAIITGAQLLAGDALRLGIKGAAIHNHIVELSAVEVARIRAGERVEKTSTEAVGLLGLHDHGVTFN